MKYCRIPIQNLLLPVVNLEYLGDCSGKLANVVLFLEHFEKASNHVLSSNFSCNFPSSSTDIFTNVHRMNRLSIWETNIIRIYDATNLKDNVFMISLLMHAWNSCLDKCIWIFRYSFLCMDPWSEGCTLQFVYLLTAFHLVNKYYSTSIIFQFIIIKKSHGVVLTLIIYICFCR